MHPCTDWASSPRSTSAADSTGFSNPELFRARRRQLAALYWRNARNTGGERGHGGLSGGLGP